MSEKAGVKLQENSLSKSEILDLYQGYMEQKSFQGISLNILKEN